LGIDSKPDSFKYDGYFNTDHLRSGLRARTIQGARATIVAQVANFGIQTIGTIILARLLTPHDFGLVTMVLTFSLLLGNFGVNGFTEAVIQTETINHRQISTLFWINVGFCLIIALLFIASSPLIVWFYKEPDLTPIIIALAASNVITGLSVQHLTLIKRNMQFHKTAANDVIASLISCSIPILLAWYGWGYWALVAKWFLVSLVTTIGAWIICRWWPGLPARGTGIMPLLRFAFHTYGTFVFSYFSRNFDKMIIGRYAGSQPLGYYDRAYHLSNMLPGQILTPLHSVTVAAFSRVSNDREKYYNSYLSMISILAFVGMPLSAALTITGKDLVLLFLGPQWDEAGQIFCAFGPSIGVAILYITHSWLHLSLGTPDRWFRWGIVAFIVTALCFIIGLRFGALGVAAGYSIAFYILIGPALWYAGRPIRLTLISVLSVIWKYYVSALAAGILCWSLLYYNDIISDIFLKFNILLRIITSVSSCLCVYLVFIVLLYKGFTPILQFTSILREMVFIRPSEK
jgi:PST family polysaccharide transporter